MIDAIAAAAHGLSHSGMAYRKISLIELNRSSALETTFALLAFIDEEALPAAFIKATSGAARARALRCEFDNLTYLATRGSERLRAGIPRPLYLGECSGVTLLVETARPGPRMKNLPPNSYFRSERFRRHFHSAMEWLLEFHRACADGPRATAVTAAALEQEIANYRHNFRVSAALDRLLGRTAERLSAAELPSSPWHGDFCSANILLPERDSICVIDWEQPLSRSWPLLDLLYFLSSIWCIPYRKGADRLAANYRQMFFGRHRHTELIRQAGSRLAGELGIGRADLLPLSAAAWLVYANRKQRELSDLKGPRGAEQGETTHWPLILLEQDRCLNLELLAQLQDDYVFS
jgi:hypothetical protein